MFTNLKVLFVMGFISTALKAMNSVGAVFDSRSRLTNLFRSDEDREKMFLLTRVLLKVQFGP